MSKRLAAILLLAASALAVGTIFMLPTDKSAPWVLTPMATLSGAIALKFFFDLRRIRRNARGYSA